MDPSVCWSPESAGGCISRVVPVRASCFLKRCRILHISTDCAAYRLIELLNAFGWAAGRWGGRRISICCNICPQLCSISTLITANICTSVGQYVAQRKKKKKKRKMLRLEPHEGVGVSSRKVTGRDGFIYLILVLSAGGSGPLKWQRCVRSIAADYSSDDGTLRADTLAGMTSL